MVEGASRSGKLGSNWENSRATLCVLLRMTDREATRAFSVTYKAPAVSRGVLRRLGFGHAHREVLEIENAQRQDHRTLSVAPISSPLHLGWVQLRPTGSVTFRPSMCSARSRSPRR